MLRRLSLAVLALATLVGCARPEPPRTPAQGPDRTILSNVRATDDLSRLAESLADTGLAETLTGTGPFTLFAPDDEAFSALPDSLRERMPLGSPERYNVLAYHVVPALIAPTDFDGRSVRTLNGASLSVEREDDLATVNRRPLVEEELRASNGIIYVIDAVLIPPGAQD